MKDSLTFTLGDVDDKSVGVSDSKVDTKKDRVTKSKRHKRTGTPDYEVGLCYTEWKKGGS